MLVVPTGMIIINRTWLYTAVWSVVYQGYTFGTWLCFIQSFAPKFFIPLNPIVLLAEGKFKLETIRVLNETDVLTRVVKGGFCKKRGINLPKTDLPVPALSDNDKEDLSVSKPFCLCGVYLLFFINNALHPSIHFPNPLQNTTRNY